MFLCVLCVEFGDIRLNLFTNRLIYFLEYRYLEYSGFNPVTMMGWPIPSILPKNCVIYFI
jgi:hypothetical protein